MNRTALLAIALTGVALTACAPRYGYHDGYAGRGYYGGPNTGGAYYTDRERYNDAYYENQPNREYRDRDYRREYDGRR